MQRIIVGSLVLSIDNLVVGFALGAFGVPVLVAAAVMGAVSVSMSVAAFELGVSVSAKWGRDGEVLAAMILICVGLAVLANII